jgi:hypothetical protein
VPWTLTAKGSSSRGRPPAGCSARSRASSAPSSAASSGREQGRMVEWGRGTDPGAVGPRPQPFPAHSEEGEHEARRSVKSGPIPLSTPCPLRNSAPVPKISCRNSARIPTRRVASLGGRGALRAATTFDRTDWPSMSPRNRQHPDSPPPLPPIGAPRTPARNEPTDHFGSLCSGVRARWPGAEEGEGGAVAARNKPISARERARAERSHHPGAERTEGNPAPGRRPPVPCLTKRTQRGIGEIGQTVTTSRLGAERTQRPTRRPFAPNEPKDGQVEGSWRGMDVRSRMLDVDPLRRETNPIRPPTFVRTNPPHPGAKRTQRGIGGSTSRLRMAARRRETNRTTGDRFPAPNEPTGYWGGWVDWVIPEARRRTNPPIRFVHNGRAGSESRRRVLSACVGFELGRTARSRRGGACR